MENDRQQTNDKKNESQKSKWQVRPAVTDTTPLNMLMKKITQINNLWLCN